MQSEPGNQMPTPSPLNLLHPVIQHWFVLAKGQPTEIQALSWPLIAEGEHILMSAPTGSGKTLSAFLMALQRLATNRSLIGSTRVLYVSPLKALGNDIARNLTTPLSQLGEAFAEAGHTMPTIRVATRNGDTSASERRRLLKTPPEILVTTPESLNLMLTTPSGRNTLMGVETLILDEVHALAGNRRGVLLTTAAERLVEIAGEVQRIALSATVRPTQAVADWVGGFDTTGTKRDVKVRMSTERAPPDFSIAFPIDAYDEPETIWKPLARSLFQQIAHSTTSLVFVNGRTLAERLALEINQLDEHDDNLCYAHHGSLARETRLAVEERLKRGELRSVVATGTLEMGIDIGSLDEVMLVQSPPSITSTVQRIGRAGHQVGATSRAKLYPLHGHDFIAAAALAKLIEHGEIEPLAVLRCPLDILAQIVLSMTASEARTPNALFAVIRRTHTYAQLPRRHFDILLEMLFGRSEGHLVRALKTRLLEESDGRIRATRGAVMDLYASGGAIPNRGLYSVKHQETGAMLGELDEEFVWEAKIGQVFALGSMSWQVRRITDADVHVMPAQGGRLPNAPPFWRADSGGRSAFFSQAIGDFLESVEANWDAASDEDFKQRLADEFAFDEFAANALHNFLRRQREVTDAPLPHGKHLLVETIQGVAGAAGAAQANMRSTLIHTLWGGQVNAPFSLALSAAIERETGIRPDVIHDDNSVILLSTPLDSTHRLLDLVTPENVEQLLKSSLEASGIFGARFRECAGRALLITKRKFGDRLPLWVSRLQAKKLMSSVQRLPDFPLMLETWRSCLEDEFDMPALNHRLEALLQGKVRVSHIDAREPSPFALATTWKQINEHYMYADDTPASGAPSKLDQDLVQGLRSGGEIRITVSAAAIAAFVQKRQRLAPGYAPQSSAEIEALIRERVLVSVADWQAIQARLNVEAPAIANSVPARCAWRIFGGQRFLVHDTLPADAFDLDAHTDTAAYLADLMSFHGPLTLAEIQALAPLPRLEALIADCMQREVLRTGIFRPHVNAAEYCDSENLEAIIRIGRGLARSRLDARDASWLPAFVSAFQNLNGNDTLAALQVLRGFSAPVETWLTDLLPTRLEDFSDAAFDEAMESAGLVFYGTGKARIGIAAIEDLEMLLATPKKHLLIDCFRDEFAKYGFLQLQAASNQSLAEFNERFWRAIWQGEITSDRLDTLREGLRRSFALGITALPRDARRGAYRWRAQPVTWQGNFFRLPQAPKGQDAIDRLDLAKERARILLHRYGIITRELATREGGVFAWQQVFAALRLLELAGEVTSGFFFKGLSGPQFALPEAVQVFQDSALLASQIRWCSVLDPMSPAGLDARLAGATALRRVAGNHLLFSGNRLLASWSASGKQVTFSSDDFSRREGEVLRAFAVHLLHARGTLTVRKVNGASPLQSKHLRLLEPDVELVREPRAVSLQLRKL